MAEVSGVSQAKVPLTDCPKCYHEYDKVDNLPRHMPCCLKPVCHSCLQKILENKKLKCPLCQHEHELPDGVTSLPEESLMFKILEHLKIQKGLSLPCTDCPDGNEAESRCDDCSIFLCEECHRAHVRSRSTRVHKTVTFEEMKGRPVESFRKLHQCKEHHQPQQFFCRTCDVAICVSCTVVDHDKTKDHDVVSVDEAHQDKAQTTDNVLAKLDKKGASLEKMVAHLEEKKINIKISQQGASEDVNSTINSLAEILKTRRTSVLTDVYMKSEAQLKVIDQALDSATILLAKIKSSTEYTREMRERADKVEDLQLMVSSTDILNTMLQETTQDVPFDRTGVTFAPVQMMEMKSLIDELGSVRTVTFERDVVLLTPAELSEVTEFDKTFTDGKRLFISPHLVFDPSTASDNLQISAGVVSNVRPDPPLQDTGCRLKSGGHVLSLQPIPMRRGVKFVFSSIVDFTVKELSHNVFIWEMELTQTPIDDKIHQREGLSMRIQSNRFASHLCLKLFYDDQLHIDNPLSKYEKGVTCNLHIAVVIDGDSNKIHVVDVKDAKVVKTISDVVFKRPTWVMMQIGELSKTWIKSELVSGKTLMNTSGFKQLLSSLK